MLCHVAVPGGPRREIGLRIKARSAESCTVFENMSELFRQPFGARLHQNLFPTVWVYQFLGAASACSDERNTRLHTFVDNTRAVVGERRHNRQSCASC